MTFPFDSLRRGWGFAGKVFPFRKTACPEFLRSKFRLVFAKGRSAQRSAADDAATDMKPGTHNNFPDRRRLPLAGCEVFPGVSDEKSKSNQTHFNE